MKLPGEIQMCSKWWNFSWSFWNLEGLFFFFFFLVKNPPKWFKPGQVSGAVSVVRAERPEHSRAGCESVCGCRNGAGSCPCPKLCPCQRRKWIQERTHLEESSKNNPSPLWASPRAPWKFLGQRKAKGPGPFVGRGNPELLCGNRTVMCSGLEGF